MQTEPIIRFDVSVDTARRFELVFNTTTHPSRVGRGVCGAEAQGRFGILQNYSRPSPCSGLVNFVEMGRVNPAIAATKQPTRSVGCFVGVAGRGSPFSSRQVGKICSAEFDSHAGKAVCLLPSPPEKVKAPFGAKLFRWRWGESNSRAVGYERSVYDA